MNKSNHIIITKNLKNVKVNNKHSDNENDDELDIKFPSLQTKRKHK